MLRALWFFVSLMMQYLILRTIIVRVEQLSGMKQNLTEIDFISTKECAVFVDC